MKVFKLLLGALACAVVVSTADAQATLQMKDGTKIKGKVTRYDEDAQTIYMRADDGRDLTLRVDQLNGRSTYLLNSSRVPDDDGPALLTLANFARDVGLYAHSARHYKRALAADAALEAEVDREQQILYQRASDFALNEAQQAIDSGDKREAEKWLKRILQKLPGTDAAARASVMLDGLYEEVHNSRDDHLEESAAELLQSDLKRGKQYYDRMLESNKKGLQASSTSRAKNNFNNAIKDGERALREIASAKKKRTDEASQATLSEYDDIVTQHVIEVRLNLASMYMTQTNYNGAQQEVNQALALDSSNEAALRMRSRIEVASSNGWGNGVIIRR